MRLIDLFFFKLSELLSIIVRLNLIGIKVTVSGRYFVYHSDQVIHNVVMITNRVLRLCNVEFRSKNLNILKGIFVNNEYPVAMVKKLVRGFHM